MSRSATASGSVNAIDAFAATLMIALTFSWGLNQVAIKVSNVGFNPVFSTALRSAIGAILVFGWCHWRRIPLFTRDGTLVPGILAGLLFGGEFVLMFFGLDYTTAARSVLMINTMPFWVLLGGHFFLADRITPLKLGGLVLAFGGVALVFSDELSLPGPEAIRGDVMCLIAGILWAVTIILIKSSTLSRASAEKTLLYQLVVSAFMAVPLIPLAGPVLREPSMLAAGSLLFQSTLVVGFTYLLWFWLMRTYSASGLSSFAFLTPVFGVLCGGVLLDEPLSMRIFFALVLIGAGLLLVNRPARRVPPA